MRLPLQHLHTGLCDQPARLYIYKAYCVLDVTWNKTLHCKQSATVNRYHYTETVVAERRRSMVACPNAIEPTAV